MLPPVALRYRYAKGILSLLNTQETQEWRNALDPTHAENALHILHRYALPYLDALVRLLLENDRLYLIQDIFRTIRELLFPDVLKVITAKKLPLNIQEAIQDSTNHKVVFDHEAALFGGMLLEYRGKAIDATYLAEIRKLERTKPC